MILQLKDVATVLSGVTFRTQVKPSSNNGGVKLIQMKDLGGDNFVRLDKSIHIEREAFNPNQFVRRGDIIFRSRGQTYTAALLGEDAGNAVVAAPLFHVRPNIKKVIPQFLFWWINQSASQSYFASLAEGSTLKMIHKRVLEDLEVKLPPLEQQKKIVQLLRYSMREQQILEEIKDLKIVYLEQLVLQILSKFPPKSTHKESMADYLLGGVKDDK